MRIITLTLLTALATATPLGGCSSLAGTTTTTTATSTLAGAEKDLTLAHLAYQAIGIALQNAAESGALHGADAGTAKTLYDQAGTALATADAADALANAQGVADAVASANALIGQIHALIPATN
ncbi:MAG TPA: hypothetical protein VG387_19065 [Rhizomicrobium sp.]|jgi:hypothetical protein|nr:hypothetical protein [Rhizomicrobium sp.]